MEVAVQDAKEAGVARPGSTCTVSSCVPGRARRAPPIPSTRFPPTKERPTGEAGATIGKVKAGVLALAGAARSLGGRYRAPLFHEKAAPARAAHTRATAPTEVAIGPRTDLKLDQSTPEGPFHDEKCTPGPRRSPQRFRKVGQETRLGRIW